MVFSKNPAKLEARAQGYESRGKTAKALKCRQKLAKLNGASPLNLQSGYGAQPMVGQQTILTQQPIGLGQQPVLMTQQPMMVNQQPMMMNQQPMHVGQQHTTMVVQPAFLPQQPFQTGGPIVNAPFAWQTQNTPARYETNALKWEQRGNYTKAQKNRGKVWRLQNPQMATVPAVPTFYNNNQFLGYNQPLPQQNFQTREMTQVETHVRPTIVQETMRPERIVEVQPIVHREIDAPQVNIIERHTYENVRSNGPSTFTNAPIIQETVRPKIIEEIQPVVHREVPAPFVEKVEQHVTEHIVNPTITTKEVQRGGVVETAPFVAAGGIQQTTTTTTTTQPGLMGKVQGALHHNQQH